MNKLVIFLFLFFDIFLYAHRVDIFPYIEGNKLIVECYFSDGTPAKNCKVVVHRGKEKILEGKTDNGGVVSFPLNKVKGEVKIVLFAGMGHRVETMYKVEEKSQVMETPQIEKGVEEKDKEKGRKYFDEGEIERKIEMAVERSVKPIIKMMEEERRRTKFSEIVAGIGYILGIFGIISLLYRK